MATLDFKDEKFPANVTMSTFNPFIPRDAKNSSLPAAFFEIEIENTTSKATKYQIALSVTNPNNKSINKADTKNEFKTLTLYNSGAQKNETEYGDLTLATDGDVSYT